MSHCMNVLIRAVFVAAILMPVSSWLAAAETLTTGTVAFGVMGDLPYSDRDEMHVGWVLEDMQQAGMRFAIHVGDLKGGSEPCSDALLARRVGLLKAGPLPVIYTPGDNEWTDCHRRAAGAYDPRERLAMLRRLVWPSQSATQEPPGLRNGFYSEHRVEQQKGWPENARWVSGALHFVSLHVVGSKNGLGQYPGSDAEMTERMDANALWLKESVDLALRARAKGLVLVFHADPDFGPRAGKGFEEFQVLLQKTAQRFDRPILLVHGDSHQFRVDQPLPSDRGDGSTWPHVSRLVAFGWPRSRHWALVTFEADRSPAFRVMVREAVASR
jgi:hypothetical protein